MISHAMLDVSAVTRIAQVGEKQLVGRARCAMLQILCQNILYPSSAGGLLGCVAAPA